jgi:hypothetical protein
VLPAVRAVLRPCGKLVVLIKPQFEALRGEVRRLAVRAPGCTELLHPPAQVGSGGVVRDPAVHASVLKRVVSGIEAMGFACQGTAPSPLRGAKEGNIEFISAFVRARVLDNALLRSCTYACAIHSATAGLCQLGPRAAVARARRRSRRCGRRGCCAGCHRPATITRRATRTPFFFFFLSSYLTRQHAQLATPPPPVLSLGA